ncbi:UNVERIFIED_CONTAM: hypothetical protein GTU68_041008 [Idotea baltica]|nr:hypothetical protein [Idotea baltica]
MVGLMSGVLGCFIVLRNMSLIGDALAHAILPGIVVAFILTGVSTLGFFIGSVMAALITSVGITWIQHTVKTKNDAAIGIMFTAMFSLGVIGISWISKNEGTHLDLKDFLFGNVLGVSNEDLILTGFVMVYVIFSVILFYRYLFVTTFQPTIAQTMGISVNTIHYFLMLLLSFAVVASLRTVGVILVVALLITPASTALLLSDKLKHVLSISAVFGFLSAVLGMIIAILLETTPGPAMAVVATLMYFIVVIIAPKKGLIAKYSLKKRLHKKIELEDILKTTLKLDKKGSITFEQLDNRIYLNGRHLKNHVQTLSRQGLIQYKDDKITLTKSGKSRASELIRAHRLWETYLVDQVGLTGDQIHDDAERLEHLLSVEVIDNVDAKLGYPRTDPHGSVIPAKEGLPVQGIIKMMPNQKGIIIRDQIDDTISGKLWDLGLAPDIDFMVIEVSRHNLVIRQLGEQFIIPNELARKITIMS